MIVYYCYTYLTAIIINVNNVIIVIIIIIVIIVINVIKKKNNKSAVAKCNALGLYSLALADNIASESQK